METTMQNLYSGSREYRIIGQKRADGNYYPIEIYCPFFKREIDIEAVKKFHVAIFWSIVRSLTDNQDMFNTEISNFRDDLKRSEL